RRLAHGRTGSRLRTAVGERGDRPASARCGPAPPGWSIDAGSSGRDAMRVALLGAGRIGRLHARLLRDTPGIDEVVIADADQARAAEVAAETGITAATSIADTIATSDATVIAAATSAHPELIRASLAAGKPTFCEKPLAPDLDGTISIAADI